MPWRELPHTADLRLEIVAADWPALLGEAAEAFAHFLGEPDRRGTTKMRQIEVAGADREEVLVRWLSELLVINELEHLRPVRVDVQQADDTSLRALVYLQPTTGGGHVKAVTYHGLAVAMTDRGLLVRIVFDT
ncbi:MAG TPA: archease [bacterium]|nr:archease [bacterium]